MSIKDRLSKLEILAGPKKMGRPIIMYGPDGPTPEQQAQLDEAEASGHPLKVVRLVRAEVMCPVHD